MTRGARIRVLSHASRSLAIAAIAVSFYATRSLAASDGSGTAAASFLSVGSGASVLSMGGATLATGTDLAAAAWNPASLARVDALQFSLTHAPLPGGATQDWLAAGGRMSGDWRWGTQLLFHREGGIEGRDASNNPTGEVSASDIGAGAHLARRFGRAVDVGVGAEWIHEALAGTSGSGLAFSGGVRASSGPFGFAIAARHIGGGMSYAGTRYDLPAVVALGTSYEDASRGLRVAADLESPTHYYRSLRLGGEWTWRGQLALRAGYRSELGNTDAARLSGPTFGMGTGAGSMWMDYAFTPGGGEGAGEHRLGLTFRPATLNRNRAIGSSEPAPAKPRPAKAAPATKSAPAHSKAGSAANADSRPAPASAPTVAPPLAAVPAPAPETKKPATENKPEPNAEIPVPVPTPVMGQGAGAASAPATKIAPPSNSGSSATAPPTPVKDAPAPTKTTTTPASASAPAATVAAPAPSASGPAKTAPVPASAPAKASSEKSTPSAAASPAPAKDVPVPTAPRADANAQTQPVPSAKGATLASSKPPVETVVRERPKSVIVGQGETLAMIAKRWDTSVAAIMMANDKVNEKVTPGTRLKLPPPAKKGPRIHVTL